MTTGKILILSLVCYLLGIKTGSVLGVFLERRKMKKKFGDSYLGRKDRI